MVDTIIILFLRPERYHAFCLNFFCCIVKLQQEENNSGGSDAARNSALLMLSAATRNSQDVVSCVWLVRFTG